MVVERRDAALVALRLTSRTAGIDVASVSDRTRWAHRAVLGDALLRHWHRLSRVVGEVRTRQSL
jgi:hypothetical protein